MIFTNGLRRVFACVLIVAAAVAANAQVSPYWQTKVDDPLYWDDSFGRVDPAGNYYLASTMSFDGGSGYFKLTKFSPTGQVLWQKEQLEEGIVGGGANQILFTASGEVLVGARYDIDNDSVSTIYHYSANGDLLWQRPGGEMKMDAAGRLFVSWGFDAHDSTYAEIARVDVATGNRVVEEVGHDAEGIKTTVTGWGPDGSGGVWAAGRIAGTDEVEHAFFTNVDFKADYILPPYLDYPYSIDKVVRRSNGDFYAAWVDGAAHVYRIGRVFANLTKDWDVPLAEHDVPSDMRLDPSENVVVTVSHYDPATMKITYALRKFSPTGQALWSRSLDANAFEYLWDPSGNMFLSDGPKLYKFLPNMSLGWANPVDTTGAGYGLSRDSAGFFYFGRSFKVLNGQNDTGYHLATKYGPTNNASFVVQNVPSAMVAGQSYSVSVTMTNTGASTWTLGDGFYLRSQNPTDNLTWGKRRIDLSPSESILPGQTKKFSFLIYAPTTAGSYKFQWKMSQGTSAFGASSPLLTIPVVVKQHGARYVSQTLPSTVKAGSTFTVNVTMRNVGTNTWTAAGGYGIAPPPGYPTWNVTKVPVAPTDSIAQGQTITFTITCKAPTTPGSYLMRWQMRRDAPAFTGFFGDMTTTKTITVTP